MIYAIALSTFKKAVRDCLRVLKPGMKRNAAWQPKKLFIFFFDYEDENS